MAAKNNFALANNIVGIFYYYNVLTLNPHYKRRQNVF